MPEGVAQHLSGASLRIDELQLDARLSSSPEWLRLPVRLRNNIQKTVKHFHKRLAHVQPHTTPLR